MTGTEVKMLKHFCDRIEWVNEWIGKITAWLILPLCFLVTYDVILRYIFNRPTVWAWDINVQFLGAMVAIGGSYTLISKGHIGVDVIVTGLSKRKQIVTELITSFFFFLAIVTLVWIGVQQAWISVKTKEVDFTFFAPPVYYLKVIIAIGFILLLLQGLVNFIRNIVALGTGEGDNR
jgi:TRAP-type mannitol/chloroaromatic compound transport system permease small subunit